MGGVGMSGFIQVTTTTEKKEQAEAIADIVIKKRLAACVQIIGPISSKYRWKGKTEEKEEWLLLMKTRETLYTPLEEEIIQLHPYEVPEILATKILIGSQEYMEWLEDETSAH